MRNDRLHSLRRPVWKRSQAFSLVEVVVAVIILTILIAIVLPSMGHSRKTVQSSVCLSQLRSLAMGFRQYALQNGNALPDPPATEISWARAIQPYVTGDGAFACPADSEVFPMTGSSYDWRDTGDPLTTLAGRPMDQGARANVVLVFESLPDWHAPKKINAARVDGSAHTMDARDCFKDLLTPIRAVGIEAAGAATRNKTKP